MQYDSVLGKMVLTYWENGGNLDYTQMNVYVVAMKNYITPKPQNPPQSSCWFTPYLPVR